MKNKNAKTMLGLGRDHHVILQFFVWGVVGQPIANRDMEDMGPNVIPEKRTCTQVSFSIDRQEAAACSGRTPP